MRPDAGRTEVRRRLATFASALVLVTGCATASSSPGVPAASGGVPPTPESANLPDLGLKNVSTQVEQARAATIGPDGGTVDATATDGTMYTLAIPAGAIEKPTLVSLYPVSKLAGIPDGSQLTAAVQFAPDGLQLEGRGTLTIGLTAAADPTTFHGLTWHGDGADLHAYPAGLSGDSVTIPIYHFSGAGVGNVPLVSIHTCTTQAEMDTALASVVGEAARGQPAARADFTEVLKRCYANFVKPTLTAASTIDVSDDIVTATAARYAYDTWLDGSAYWASGFFPGFSVSPEVAASKPLAVTFLRNWFETANAACIGDADNPEGAVLAAEVAVGTPHLYGPRWGIDSQANKLDYETLLNEVCVQLIIDPSRGYSGSKPGDSGTVTVPVGYSIAGQAVGHDLGIHLKLTRTGASGPFAEADAPPDGTFTAPLTWPDLVNPLQIDVLASFVDAPDVARFDRISKSMGSKFAAEIRDSGNHSRIAVLRDNGDDLQYVTSGPGDMLPSWSPDGAKIAFARASGAQGTEIEVMNADGTGLVALTAGPGINTSPEWSPDGTRIAFLRYHGELGPYFTIVLMNPDGTNVVDTMVKVYAPDGRVSWSPDSKRLVYSTLDPSPGSGTDRLWVMNLTGGGTTKLDTHACAPWGAGYAEWSPIGVDIAFNCVTHGNPNGSNIIALGSAITGGSVALTKSFTVAVSPRPTWSSDGTKIAYGAGSTIVIRDVADAGGSTITVGGSVNSVDWGP